MFKLMPRLYPIETFFMGKDVSTENSLICNHFEFKSLHNDGLVFFTIKLDLAPICYKVQIVM